MSNRIGQHSHSSSLRILNSLIIVVMLVIGSVAYSDIFTVENIADDGNPGSLRWAMNEANTSAGLDTIRFEIAGTGPHTIQPSSALPTITDPVLIDGYSQAGAVRATETTAATLQVEIDGSSAGGGVDGLTITSGGSTVRGIVLNRFGNHGIYMTTGGGNVIEGNHIGTDVAGTGNAGNNMYAVYAVNSPNNTIGGTDPGARNVVSGSNWDGVFIRESGSSGNVVQGNYIGVDATGTARLGNRGTGVIVYDAPDNTIGGSTAGARNVVSDHNIHGVIIQHAAATGNIVQGNYIGTDKYGTGDLGNNRRGLEIWWSAHGNMVGGSGSGEGNLIAYSGEEGIYVQIGADNTLSGNSIHSNGGLGIDLHPLGQTSNDVGDGDAGANNLQNYPVITSATYDGANTTIGGTLNSSAGTTFSIEVFSNTAGDASGFGEGETYLAGTTCVTDGSGNGTWSLVTSGDLSNEILTSTATDPAGNTSEFGQVFTGGAPPTELIVTNTNDSGNGSLRQVLLDANAAAGLDTITFSIAGAGPHTIQPLSALPTITDPVLIDGYTQAGALPATETTAAVLQIEIDGISAGGGVNCVNITGGGSTVRGLVINRFNGHAIDIETNGGNVVEGNHLGTDVNGSIARNNAKHGVYVNNSPANIIGGDGVEARNVVCSNNYDGIYVNASGATGNVIQGNYVGIDASGEIALGNGHSGVVLYNAPQNTIGGATSAARNLVSGNPMYGVVIQTIGATDNVIQGNYVGTDVSGINDVGNGYHGVYVLQSSGDNVIGGLGSGESNLIAYNGWDGIYVESGVGNAMSGNAIHSNGQLGIDLGTNGVTTNDVGDGDTGANNLQNYPVITGATYDGANTTISGTLNSAAGTTFAIEVFSNTAGDPSGNGEGETYLGSTTCVTDGTGNGTWALAVGGDLSSEALTSTATDPSGNTSEFGQVFTGETPPSEMVVVNTNDSGAGSFRQAILDANASAGLDTIRFEVAGSGPHTIQPLSVLPTITDPVLIDGYSQAGAVPATETTAATLKIELEGSSAGGGVNGLNITAGASTVRGLVINRFGNHAINIETDGGNVIEGNYIGTDVSGTIARGNTKYAIYVNNAPNNTIGGTAASARNLISGGAWDGIFIQYSGSSGNVVQGNYIGTDVTGMLDLGNYATAMVIHDAPNNTVGGTTPGAGNVISGNDHCAVLIQYPAATGNVVQGNFIGTDASGTADVGNDNFAVSIWHSASGNTVGGTGIGEANVIAYSNGYGICVHSGVNNIFSGNSIHSNGTLGIDLGYNGVTANDVGDGDAGANNYQNFPVMTEAVYDGVNTTTSGTLNSTASLTFNIEVFSNTAGDPSGYGEGETYLGSTTCVTDGSGDGTWALVVGEDLASKLVTVTATDPSGNTSEFGESVEVEEISIVFTVANIDDSGVGSLRQAILDANASAGLDTIYFAIPGTGPHTIQPLSVLPTITDPVLIDGYSQAGAVPATETTAAVLQIEIDGSSAGSGVNGMDITGGGCTVRGLVLNRFSYHGIYMTTGGGNVIEGNHIGTDVAGTGSAGNSQYAVYMVNSAGNVIGGTDAGSRNVISGSNWDGVFIRESGSSGNVVQGNYIGVDATGMARLGNRGTGVIVYDAPDNTIGGSTAGARNIISDHNIHGVIIQHVAATGNIVQGNYIGTDKHGTGDLGNNRRGLEIWWSAHGNVVGGSGAGEGNLIAYNGEQGIYVQIGIDNTLSGNSIHSNGGLGIDLDPQGVTANDVGDGDSGCNNLQNYPVITSAVFDGANTTIDGALNSAAGTTFAIEVFSNTAGDPSGYGEGETYMGSTTCVTDGSGDGTWALVIGSDLTSKLVTVTATDPDGNTSEFSATLDVTGDNSPPVAVEDSYGVSEDGVLCELAPGVVGNDSDMDDDLLTAYLMGDVSDGILVLNADGSFTYTPDSNFNGTDSFTYKAYDGTDYSDVATVTITVNGVNDAPVAEDDSFEVDEGDTLDVTSTGGINLSKMELVSTFVEGFAVGDVDNDGALDLVLTKPLDQSVEVYDNQYSLKYTISISGAPRCVAIADFDDDGNNELAIGASGGTIYCPLDYATITGECGNITNPLYIGEVDDSGVFSVEWTSPNYYFRTAQQLLAGDFNSNGIDEIVIGGTYWDRRLMSYEYNGSTYVKIFEDNITSDVESVCEADGKLVAGTACWGDYGLRVYDNYNLIFSALGEARSAVAAGDADGDGDIDIVRAIGGTCQDLTTPPGAIWVYDDTYDHVYTSPTLSPTTDTRPWAAVGELVAGGGEEIAVGTSSAFSDPSPDNIRLFQWNGSTYTEIWRDDLQPPQEDAYHVVIEDLDGDGQNELYVSTTYGLRVYTMMGGAGVLANDTDIDGDPLTASLVDDVSNGSLTLNSDGSFTYSPDMGFRGMDSFTYQASDGWLNSNTATVAITVNEAVHSFVVATIVDNGDGSFRQALLDANASAGLDTIRFEIPGDGPHTIQPLSVLPTITDPVLIDGYSQSGALPATETTAAVLMIELDGSSAGDGVNGLNITSGASTVRGLVINRFGNHGINIETSGGNVVEGNHLGTDVSGTIARGCTKYSVYVNNAPNNTIGGTAAGARNVISGSDWDGVFIQYSGATGNVVQGNYIGVDATGIMDLGNRLTGLVISDAPNTTVGGTVPGAGNVISGNDLYGLLIHEAGTAGTVVQGNRIGTDLSGTVDLGNSDHGVIIWLSAHDNVIGGSGGSGEANIIAYNGGEGIYVQTGVGNVISRNSIHSNGGLGIDLLPEGVTSNDAGDGDSGPNNMQNYPVITVAEYDGANTTINGTLNSAASTTFTIEVFGNTAADASGFGEGETYLGNTMCTTDGSGDGAWALVVGEDLTGKLVTVTATDPAGNTSEFSEVCSAVPSDLVVTTENDSGTGSLRQAILDANATAGPDTITFAMEGTGPHTIQPDEPLPTITDTVVIDGSAQNAAYKEPALDPTGPDLLYGDSDENQPDGGPSTAWSIELDGSLAGSSANGFSIVAGGCVIRGLVINRFDGHGIYISGAGGNLIEANGIGIDLTGILSMGNAGAGVYIQDSPGNMIGGEVPGVGNVLSGNDLEGVALVGAGTTGNVIAGNYVGADVTGSEGVPNSSHGIRIVDASNNTIGTMVEGGENVIAFNSGDGIFIESGDRNTLVNNAIFSNGDLGIDLGADGVTANDAGDGDSGPNALQNYPVLSSAIPASGTTVVEGTLNSAANMEFRLEFFSNSEADSSGFGEGETVLAETTVTTDASGDVSFTVELPFALSEGTAISATATDQAGNTSEFSRSLLVCTMVNVSGTVSGPDGGLIGVEVDLIDAAGNLYMFTSTDEAGLYLFEDIPAGDYSVSIVTPLGYVADTETHEIIVAGVDITCDFTLATVEIVYDQRSVGFWKHQVKVYLSGNGNAQIPEDEFCEYLGLIRLHFNNNEANPVPLYIVEQPADRLDSLEAADDLLGVRGNVPMVDRAKQQLMGLLLNVVSGKLPQFAPVSDDGATASQAITYCWMLITDSNEPNDETAKDIADQINNGITVPAGVIPPTTDDIAYFLGPIPLEFALYQNCPNPARPITLIKYNLPRSCHVRLSVYNLSGQEVTRIVDGMDHAGYNRVVWDGSSHPAGVYLYKLVADGRVFRKTMVLIK